MNKETLFVDQARNKDEMVNMLFSHIQGPDVSPADILSYVNLFEGEKHELGDYVRVLERF